MLVFQSIGTININAYVQKMSVFNNLFFYFLHTRKAKQITHINAHDQSNIPAYDQSNTGFPEDL